jgi:hypothetical protein
MLVLGADVRSAVPAAAALPDDGTWLTLQGPVSQYALVSRVRELLGTPEMR